MITPLLIAGCILLGQAETPSGASSDDALARRVRRLVRQLDAPRLTERDEAEAQLIELGPGVLDLLPDNDDRVPPDVKHRLGVVRQKLELVLAGRSAKASLVTLDATGMPISKVLQAIGQQTGNKIDLADEVPEQTRQAKIDVALDKRPFWEALDIVLDKGQLTVYPYAEQRAIRVIPRPEAHLPRCKAACYSGPFRFTALRAIARRELRETIGDGLQIGLEATWEPRVAPIFLKQRMETVRAVTGTGDPLATGSSGAEFEIAVGPGQMAAEVVVPLELPPRDAKTIGSLKGSLTALLPGRTETFRFSNLAEAKNAEQRKGGVTVTLERVRKVDEIWEVRVRVRFDQAGDALASHRGWILDNEAYLVDADDKRVESGGMETTRRTTTEAGMAYYFAIDRPPGEYRFVYRTPTLLTTKDFAYEIKDIELP